MRAALVWAALLGLSGVMWWAVIKAGVDIASAF